MMSLFPGLLFLGPLGTTLIRVAAGFAFIYFGYFYWTTRGAIANERFPLMGKCPEWLVVIGALIAAATGLLLLVGLWTQAAAIAGALGALKAIVLGRRFRAAFPFPRSTSLLLLIICLALLVTGAGLFAIDLPL